MGGYGEVKKYLSDFAEIFTFGQAIIKSLLLILVLVMVCAKYSQFGSESQKYYLQIITIFKWTHACQLTLQV